jgi:hypothetical protein
VILKIYAYHASIITSDLCPICGEQ